MKKMQRKQKRFLDSLQEEYESSFYDMYCLFYDECHKIKHHELEIIVHGGDPISFSYTTPFSVI
jgi:hypothetical protein